MTMLGVAGLVAWGVAGAAMGLRVAVVTARHYRPDKLDVSPGLAALMIVLCAPLVAFFGAVYYAQRPITRWALRKVQSDA